MKDPRTEKREKQENQRKGKLFKLYIFYLKRLKQPFMMEYKITIPRFPCGQMKTSFSMGTMETEDDLGFCQSSRLRVSLCLLHAVIAKVWKEIY